MGAQLFNESCKIESNRYIIFFKMVRKKFFISALVVILLAIFTFLFSNKKTVKREDNGKIHIVTSFLPLWVFTKNIVRDLAVLDNLLPPGTGPHEYSFKPSDVILISQADILFINGQKLEPWVKGLVESSGNKKLRTIDLSESFSEKELIGNNPHFWLSPRRAKTIVKKITAVLVENDFQNKERYTQNLNAYLQKLDELDLDYQRNINRFSQKNFIAFHPAFVYLAKDYGLNQVRSIEPSPGREPTASEIREIINLIKSYNLKGVFSEPQFSGQVVQTVAKETGIKIAPLDPLETGEFGPDYYEKIMRKNLLKMSEIME